MLDPSPGTSSLRTRRFGHFISSLLVKSTVWISCLKSLLRRRDDRVLVERTAFGLASILD